MARTFVRQDTQIRNSDLYDDTVIPTLAAYETNPTNIQDDLSSIRSQLQNFLNRSGGTFPVGNWWDDTSAPVTFENGAKRGINTTNQDLHDLERKRVLVAVTNLSDVTVPATQNYVVLSLAQVPSNTIAAVGAVTTRGTVVASIAGSFAAHSLVAVTGSNAIDPKNLCEIVDGATREKIQSSGRDVFALLQSENATDGFTITGTTPNRVQLSFVRITAAGDALEAVPVADIENKIINYSNAERKALQDLNEQDFLRGAVVDVAASTTVTRQTAYDNQGTLPVELLSNATLDLNSAAITWKIRDLVNADLLKILEGSTGGTSEIQFGVDVDVFNNDAVVNDFRTGLRTDTAGQRIDVGVNTGVIESTGANDLRILGAAELLLDDGNQTGSTWAQTTGIKLSDTTAEWNLFETNYGEVSLLNAINQAKNSSSRFPKVYSNVTVTTNANLDVSLADGNLDTALPAMNLGSYLTDYDVYLNGNLLRPGANSGANHDYYPGTAITAPAQIKFEFKVKVNDVLCVIPYA